jgi:MoaA/NifB/PqqE/SkfB family radical SAM enzyme
MQGAFRKTLEMIAMVSDLHRRYPNRIGRVVVTTSISRGNLDSLREIVRVTRESGALPAFTFVRGSSHGVRNLSGPAEVSTFEPDYYADYLTPAEMRQAIEILIEELWMRDPGNLLYSYNRATLQTIAHSLEYETGQVDCRMGWADLVILHNGDVARCEMLKSFASLADFDWSLERLLRSALFTDYMRRTSGCWCTHECGIGVSIMDEPRLIRNLFEEPNGPYRGLPRESKRNEP